MTASNRKLLGTVLILLSLVVWAIAGTAIYANFLGTAPGWVLIVYFAVAGLLWFFPAAWLIRFMSRPD